MLITLRNNDVAEASTSKPKREASTPREYFNAIHQGNPTASAEVGQNLESDTPKSSSPANPSRGASASHVHRGANFSQISRARNSLAILGSVALIDSDDGARNSHGQI
jgi:hypothetical protein